MLKIMDPASTFRNGYLQLSPSKIIFHVLHSKTASVMVGLPGPTVPLPHIFKLLGDGKSETDLDLQGAGNPAIAMLRMLVSPTPYTLHSSLSIGYIQKNGIPIIHRTPVIRCKDQSSEPIRIASTLMICDNAEFANATPLSEEESEKIKFVSSCKAVVINENLNKVIEFDEFLNQSERAYFPSSAQPGKPIIKAPAPTGGADPAVPPDSVYHAQLFAAVGQGLPKIGECPATPFNTVMVMGKSQNTLNLLPKSKLSPLQHLFLKHVVLHRMGVENILPDFVSLYDSQVQAVDPIDVNLFEELISTLTMRAENAIFFLNSICDHKFDRPIGAGGTEATRTALEKYFVMFRPRDLENSLNFAATIVDLMGQGEDFHKLLNFTSRFMKVNDCATDSNVLKIYALLTS